MSAPVLSVKALLEYARTKPADKTYNHRNGYNCALAQYGRHLGFKNVIAAYTFFYAGSRPHYIKGLSASVVQSEPNTWGGLVDRLEER